MAATTSNRNATTKSAAARQVENPREITKDIVDYLTVYARENPGYAALGCVAVGFVLGWKLKPW